MVDTSIVIKWIIDEPDSDIAMALLVKWISEGTTIIAPLLLAYEVANVLYQRLHKGLITLDETEQLLTYVLLKAIDLDISQSHILSIRAIKLSHQFSLPAAYDAHYLALAERENCEYWTADKRLLNAINGKLPWVHKLEDYHTLM
ncbi:MAG: type II toxin-antitoxin system VapC family toxin [Ktedonobacteraceae bacterium]